MKYTEARVDFLNTFKAIDYHKIESFNRGDYFKDNEAPTNSEVLNFIADFTNVDSDILWSQSVATIKTLYTKLMEQFAEYKPSEPPKELKINGTTYTFRTEYLKMSVGWWEHIKMLTEQDANPIDKLGLLYIEKGFGYAEMDKNKNIINPTDVRTKLIAEHLTLKQFIDVHQFFFTILEMYKNLSEEEKKLLRKKVSRLKLKMIVERMILN
jgi:hypothetical protein